MNIGLWFARWRSSHPLWYGDEDSAVLINLKSGRAVGRYHHDGHGKWEVDVCLPYWRALRLILTQPAWFAAAAAFPFCWVSILRSKSQEGAQASVENFAGLFLVERDVPEKS